MPKMIKRHKKKMTKNTLLTIHRLRFPNKGQVILEFTFCMIIVLIMIFGVARVFFWTGRDLVERRKAHDRLLFSGGTPIQQVNPYFYTPVKMNAIWNGI